MSKRCRVDPNSEILHLRKVSRQQYLKRREKKKIDDLKDEIIDDELLFEGVNLSSKEKAELTLKKELHHLIQSRKLREEDEIGYQIPEEYDNLQGNCVQQKKRFSAGLERINDSASPLTLRETWEEHQMKKSTLTFGSKFGNPKPHYEFVFEDQMEKIRNCVTDRMNHNSVALKANLSRERKSLPIAPLRNDFLQAVKDHQILIIVGETGCGKTTQIPQYLHEAGYTGQGTIACTQPRRVAAMSVAARVSREMRVKLGHEVGYSIRFEDCTSDKTVIKYMTDGKMLREFLEDPVLSSYSVIMIDEAHERSISTDILFGLVKDVARFRPDLKLLISSATLDAEKFSDFFDCAPIFKIPGRMFPVEIKYTTCPQSDYLESAISTALQIHVKEEPGEVLVFLTGQEEIEYAEEILEQKIAKLGSKIDEMIICPIYSNLPSELQAKIFKPSPEGARKVVLATNIAETSLTIEGIRYVIDTGFSKMKSYSPHNRMESLKVTPISKASARQRAGRAGRTSPGKCFRLYTKSYYKESMEDSTTPEIQRTNLANVVLTLKSLGVSDLQKFDFMDPPSSESLMSALELLYAIGALNKLGELTKLGRQMVEFPLDPMLSKAIVASQSYRCSEEMITIAAMLSIGNAVFYRPKGKNRYLADVSRMRFHESDVGDHIALMRVYNEWRSRDYSTSWCYENYVQAQSMKRARDVREQLEGLLDRVEIERTSSLDDLEAIKKSITAGFFPHCARLYGSGAYRRLKNARMVELHPSSGLAHMEPQPKWVVYHELVNTSKEYMRQVTEIDPQWLLEIAPHYYKSQDVQDPAATKMPRRQGRSSLSGSHLRTKLRRPSKFSVSIYLEH